ncbi:hypothetical protein D3C78_1923130 [compost metagenome]
MQFAGSQNFWRERGDGHVGGKHGHLQQDTAGALGVDQHQVVVGLEQRQEIA